MNDPEIAIEIREIGLSIYMTSAETSPTSVPELVRARDFTDILPTLLNREPTTVFLILTPNTRPLKI
jgi:hypothetical protein